MVIDLPAVETGELCNSPSSDINGKDGKTVNRFIGLVVLGCVLAVGFGSVAGCPKTKKTSTDSSTKATDTKPTDTKATDTKATDTKATDTKATDTKATDTKATDTKATDTKK